MRVARQKDPMTMWPMFLLVVGLCRKSLPFSSSSAHSGAGSNAGSNGKQSSSSRGRCGSSPGSCSGCSSARGLTWCGSRRCQWPQYISSSLKRMLLLGSFCRRGGPLAAWLHTARHRASTRPWAQSNSLKFPYRCLSWRRHLQRAVGKLLCRLRSGARGRAERERKAMKGV